MRGQRPHVLEAQPGRGAPSEVVHRGVERSDAIAVDEEGRGQDVAGRWLRLDGDVFPERAQPLEDCLRVRPSLALDCVRDRLAEPQPVRVRNALG